MQFPDLFGVRSRRNPIKKKGSKLSKLRFQQKGKCKRCHRSFDVINVRPQIHHKNGKPYDNRLSNLTLVCPNCHDKLSHKQSLRRPVNRSNPLFSKLPRGL